MPVFGSYPYESPEKNLCGIAAIDLRNGAAQWGLFRDPANPRRFVETYFAESWAEHLRQRERLTMADHEIEQRALGFHQADGRPPARSHFVNALPDE